MSKEKEITHTYQKRGDFMFARIRKAREDAGYTREKFAELLDVSVSYLAEVERGRTNVSVKTLIKICKLLGLSADYVLFGESRNEDAELLEKLHRLDEKCLPVVTQLINNLLALSTKGQDTLPQ